MSLREEIARSYLVYGLALLNERDTPDEVKFADDILSLPAMQSLIRKAGIVDALVGDAGHAVVKTDKEKGGGRMSCKNCQHYWFYEAITHGTLLGYAGKVPCNTCSRFSWLEDNYVPKSAAENRIVNYFDDTQISDNE